MVTLEEIISHLEQKSKKGCQPSMDGSRERYYSGLSDAYADCACMLKKFINQFNEEELDKIAQTECNRLLNNNICHADDILEFFKAGYRHAIKYIR